MTDKRRAGRGTRATSGEPTTQQRERGRRFAQWFSEALRRSGKNAKQVADQTNRSATYYYDLLNDGINKSTGIYKRPSEIVVRAIADATGANVADGLRSAGYHAGPVPPVPEAIATLPPAAQSALQNLVQALGPADLALLPVVGHVGAGESIWASEHVRERIPIPRRMLKNNNEHECYAVRVRGDCLAGEHILPNDLLLCKHVQTADDGDIVVVLQGEEVIVKRLRRTERGMWLETHEADGRRRIVELGGKGGDDEEPRIIGVKIGLYREG